MTDKCIAITFIKEKQLFHVFQWNYNTNDWDESKITFTVESDTLHLLTPNECFRLTEIGSGDVESGPIPEIFNYEYLHFYDDAIFHGGGPDDIENKCEWNQLPDASLDKQISELFTGVKL